MAGKREKRDAEGEPFHLFSLVCPRWGREYKEGPDWAFLGQSTTGHPRPFGQSLNNQREQLLAEGGFLMRQHMVDISSILGEGGHVSHSIAASIIQNIYAERIFS